MVKVSVHSLFRTEANASGVVLKEIDGDRMLAIIIGEFETHVIAMSMEAIQVSRPLTFDLFGNLIESLNGLPEKVVISEVKDDTFYATLQLRFRSKPCQIDTRPSDALALAVRHHIPIFVNKSVFKANTLDISKLKLVDGNGKKKGAKAEEAMLDMLSTSAFRDNPIIPAASKLTSVQVEGIFETDVKEKGVLLMDAETGKVLPIGIGEYESRIIAMGIEKMIAPRPLTHDVMLNTIAALDATVRRIIIDEAAEPGFFYAIIQLYRQPRKFVIDARPSDAIALALKSGAPIFARKAFMKRQ